MAYPPPQPTVTPSDPSQPSQGRKVPLLIGAVVVLLIAVAGLAFALLTRGDDKPVAASPAATTAASSAAVPSPTASAGFTAAAELRLALIAGGVACNKAELVEHDGKGPRGLIDATISCYRGSAELDLDVYDSAGNASGRVAYQSALLEGFGLDPAWFAIGDNWTVQCETRSDCEAVTSAIGGRVESTS